MKHVKQFYEDHPAAAVAIIFSLMLVVLMLVV